MQPTEAINIRVLVADNTRMYTQLLANALSNDPELKVVAGTANVHDTTLAVKQQKIDVLVLGSNLDEEPLRGIALLRELRSICPGIKSIILLDSSKRETVLEAFRAGARGLFSRHESLETLCKCVHQVHAGQIWANSEQMSYAVEALTSSPMVRAVDAKGLDLLSKRELEVVTSLTEGLTNREIAERLGLSQHTIKNYLFRIFDKLGVSSRTELLFLTLNHSISSPTGVSNLQHIGNNEAEIHTKQASRGNAEELSFLSLARKYEAGMGVAQDFISAYMWYSLAETSVLQEQETIQQEKRRLGALLSADQIHEAQKRLLERQKDSRQPRSTKQESNSATASLLA